ncbi:hypothetical protein M4C22_14670 [Klebsiella pneumoniae]|nr:hypothetical protein [Klebsiella pneumoniae]HDS6617525.1 hypothetical protein [Klebsiella pneumoniae]
MSVPNQTPYNIYTANGLTTVFAYQFMIMNAGDIEVSINGTPQTSGYTVQGAGQTGGGQVVFMTPPANGSVVMLLRKLVIKRDTDYQDNGDLLAETINADFDRLWLAMQQAFLSDSLSLKRPLLGGPYNAGGLKIINLQEPTNPQDAATKGWVDLQYTIPIAEAKQAAEESKEARDEAREIADKFGDVDGAIAAAESARDAAQSAESGAEAARDEAAQYATEAGINFPTFNTVEEGIAGVADGEYFRKPEQVGGFRSFTFYQRVGSTAVEKTDYPSATALKQTRDYVDSTAVTLHTENLNTFNSGISVYLENAVLKSTITDNGATSIFSDNSMVLSARSFSLVYGGDTGATIEATSGTKTLFSRTLYPGETYSNGVLKTPYRAVTLQGSDSEIRGGITIGENVSVLSILAELTPNAWFDGTLAVFSLDGIFKTTTQGGQATLLEQSIAGGIDGSVRFGFPNSDITAAGYEISDAGVRAYYTSQFSDIRIYYRSVAPSNLISEPVYGIFSGTATVNIQSPVVGIIDVYTRPEKEVMAPATLVGTYNADIKNITAVDMIGVPSEIAIQFSPGEVSTHAALRLTDENGTEYPCQFAGDVDANLRRDSDISRYVDASFNTGKVVFFADLPASTSRRFRLETYGTRGKTVAEWGYPKLRLNADNTRWEITVGEFTWQFLATTGAIATVLKGGASIGVQTLRRIVAVTDGAAVENTDIISASLALINTGPVFAEVEQTVYHAAQGGVLAGDIKSVTRYRLFNTGAIYIYNVFRAEREIPANNLYGVRLDVQLSGGADASYSIHAGASIATNVPFEGHNTWNLVNEFVMSDTVRDTISNENTWGCVRPYTATMLLQGTALRTRSGWLFTALDNRNLLEYVTPKNWTWPAGHWLFPYSVGDAENTISNRVLNRPCGVFYRGTPTHVLRQRIYQQLERLMDGVFELYTNPDNGQVSATDYSNYRYPQVYGLYDALRNGEDFDTRYGYFKTFITDKIGSYSNAGNAYLTGAWTLQFSGRMCFAAVEMYFRYAKKINNTTVMDDLKIFIVSACDGLAQKIETSGAAPLGGNENNKGGGNSNMDAYRMLAIGIYAGVDTAGRYQAAINTIVNMMKTNSYATHAYPTLMDTFDSYPFLNRWLSYEAQGYYTYLRACRLLNTTPEFDNSNYLMRGMQGNGTVDYLRFIRAEDRRGFCETPGAAAIGLLMHGGVSGINAAALLLDKFERDWSLDPIAQPHLCDFRQLTTPLTVAYEGFEHVVNQFAIILLDRQI